MWLLLALSSAWAGSGPWSLRSGQSNLYVGVSYHRYNSMIGPGPLTSKPPPNGWGNRTLVDLGTAMTAYGVDGVWTLGLRPRLEAELKFSLESVRANEPTVGLCSPENNTPDDFCEPTFGIGDLYGTLKWVVVDEFAGAPLSAALRFEARTGEAYANTRNRLTNLGEGQTDIGVQLSIGRKAYINTASMRVHLTGGYFYSFGNGVIDGVKAPADELNFDAELMVTPMPAFEIGPAIAVFERLGGVPIGTDPEGNPYQDFDDINVWNRLDATQIKLGGKMSLFSTQQRTITLTVLGTLYAENNPANAFTIALGGGQLFEGKRDTGE